MSPNALVAATLLALAPALASANRLLLVHEANETDLADLFESSLPAGVSVAARLAMDHEADGEDAPLCGALEGGSFSAVVDLSWGGWAAGRRAAGEAGAPYVHVEASNKPFVMGMDDFLYARDAIDAALLFETETELDQSLYHIIGNYHLRVLVRGQRSGLEKAASKASFCRCSAGRSLTRSGAWRSSAPSPRPSWPSAPRLSSPTPSRRPRRRRSSREIPGNLQA